MFKLTGKIIIFYIFLAIALVMQPVLADMAADLSLTDTKSGANVIFSILWVAVFSWRFVPAYFRS